MKLKEFFNIQESVNDKNILKAIFLAGSPGAGKTTLAKKAFGIDRNNISSNSGMKFISADSIYERKGGPRKMNFNRKNVVDKYEKSIDMASDQFSNLMESSVSIVIDGTGRNYDSIKNKKTILEAYNYTCFMLYITAPEQDALKRNRKREERSLEATSVAAIHREVSENINEFKALFGKRLFIIDNSEERRRNDEKELKEKNKAIQSIKGTADFKKRYAELDSEFRKKSTVEGDIRKATSSILSEKIPESKIKAARGETEFEW